VYLKNPPADWVNGPVDAEKELDDIKLQLAKYSSEYALQEAIHSIVTRSRNYHWNYEPDILTIFIFTRPVGVASVSSDGKSLPKLYVDHDIALLRSAAHKAKVSEIVEINGEDAYGFLERVSAHGQQFLDADGRLNKMFSMDDTGSIGAFERHSLYEDDKTTLKFANGTVVELENTASLSKLFRESNANITDFVNVTDGQSFFDTFCTGLVAGKPSDGEKSLGHVNNMQPGRLDAPRRIPHNYHDLHKRAEIPETNYSSPVVESNSSAVSGYFLHSPGYEDVAVLKMITFYPEDDPFGNNFLSTIRTFLAKCVEAKKQKLIIDLRENGGGATNLLFDAFMQLFPRELPFSAQWYRATEEFTAIGNAVSKIQNSPEFSASYEDIADGGVEQVFRFWSYWHFLTAQNKNFKSWDEFKGPHKNNGDLYTTVFRYNVRSPFPPSDPCPAPFSRLSISPTKTPSQLSNKDDYSIRFPGWTFLNYTSLP
jgi:hypothetical protein